MSLHTGFKSLLGVLKISLMELHYGGTFVSHGVYIGSYVRVFTPNLTIRFMALSYQHCIFV